MGKQVDVGGEKVPVAGLGCIALVVLCAAFGVLTLIGCGPIHSVSPGNVGVVFDRGAHKVVSVSEPGWVAVMPFMQSIQDYPVTIQTYEMVQKIEEGKIKSDDSIKVQSREGQQLNLDVVVQYQVERASAAALYTDWGGADIGTVEDRVVRQYVRSAVPVVAGGYGWEDISGEQRGAVNAAMTTKLVGEFEKRHLALVSFSIREVHLPAALQAQLEKKIEAQQVAERKNYELQEARVEARRTAAEAAGAYTATVKRAEAQAESQRLVNQGLTPAMLQNLYLNKWDGRLPQYQLGGATPLIQMPGPSPATQGPIAP